MRELGPPRECGRPSSHNVLGRSDGYLFPASRAEAGTGKCRGRHLVGLRDAVVERYIPSSATGRFPVCHQVAVVMMDWARQACREDNGVLFIPNVRLSR